MRYDAVCGVSGLQLLKVAESSDPLYDDTALLTVVPEAEDA